MSETKSAKTSKWLDRLRHAFSMESPHGPLTDEDRDLIGRLAQKIVARGMALPAVLFLQSIQPLNAIGSQAMVFLRPFLTGLFFNPEQYDRLAAVLERREGLGALVEAVETAQAAREGKPS